MKNSSEPQLSALLADAAFAADWPADLPYRFDTQGRNAVLCDLIKGQRVVHLGFADHGPLIAAKRQQGVWLHDHVMVGAEAVIGIDINAEAVALAEQMGVPDLHCVDVFSPDFEQLVDAFQPACWLLPDVLEHLHEPVRFLRRLAEVSSDMELVVSVPNGLSLRNAIHALQGVERINTDHVCWYSPFTALKLLRRGGFEFEQLRATQIAPAASLKGRLLQGLVAKRPVWADNLIIRARPSKGG